MEEMIKNENEKTNSTLTVQEQQQAYVEAMKQLKKEEKQEKKRKRRKRLLVVAAIFVAIIAVSVISAIIPSASDIGDAANAQALLPSSSVDEETVNAYKESIETAIDNYIGNKDPNSAKIQSALIEQAQRAMESGNAYFGASVILEHCADNEEAKDIISECNYRLAIEYIKNYNYSLAKFYIDKLDNYKNSSELSIWIQYQWRSTFAIDSVKVAVKNSCKDPSSFREEYGSQIYYDLKEDSNMESGYSLRLEINLVYSATNSFGGRLEDTYFYETTPVEMNLYGKTIEEAKKIIETTQTDILKNCE